MSGGSAPAKIGVHLAWGRDKELRLRQVLIGATAALATVGIGLGIQLTRLEGEESARIAQRAGQLIDVRADGSLTADPAEAPLFARPTIDRVAGNDVVVVYLDPRVDEAPIPPGLAELPGVGEFVVTPALARLLESEPASALRYEQISIIGPQGVASGEELLAWTRTPPGTAADQLRPILGFGDPGDGSATEKWVLDPTIPGAAVAAIAVLLLVVPLLALLVVAGRTSSPARSRRFELFRRLGVKRRSVQVIATIEGLSLALPGALVGAALAIPLFRHATELPLLNVRVVEGVLLPSWSALLTAVAVVCIAVGLVSLPTTTVERTSRLATRARRASPFIPAIAGLVCFFVGASGTSTRSLLILLIGVVLLSSAVALSMPVMLNLAGTVVAAGGGATRLLAGRRMAANRDGVGTSLAALAFLIVLSSAALTWIAVGQDDAPPDVAQFVIPGDAATTERLVQELGNVGGAVASAPIVRGGDGDKLMFSCDELARRLEQDATVACQGAASVDGASTFDGFSLPFNGFVDTTTDGVVVGAWVAVTNAADVEGIVRATARPIAGEASVLTNASIQRPGRVQAWIEWGFAVGSFVVTSAFLILVLQRAVVRRPTEELVRSLGAGRGRIATMEAMQLCVSYTLAIAAAIVAGIVLASRLVAFGKSEQTPYADILTYGGAVWLASAVASAAVGVVVWNAATPRARNRVIV